MSFPEALDSDCVLIIHDGLLTEHLAKHLDLDPTREQQLRLSVLQCLDLLKEQAKHRPGTQA